MGPDAGDGMLGLNFKSSREGSFMPSFPVLFKDMTFPVADEFSSLVFSMLA